MLLNLHRIALDIKPEAGVTRLIDENLDGFNTRISDNDKLEKVKETIDNQRQMWWHTRSIR